MTRKRRLTVTIIASVLIALSLIALLPRVTAFMSTRPDPVESASNIDHYGTLAATEDDQDAIETFSADLTASEFLQDAALVSRFELLAAELAMERATSNEITALAERIAADHKRIGRNLENRANAAGIDLPQRLTAKHRAQLQKLQKAGSASFDHSYVESAMANNQVLSSLFRAASTNTAIDQNLSVYAKDTLHVLDAHDREMQRLFYSNIGNAALNARAVELQ